MSINVWLDKEDVLYRERMEYYLAIKKNEILPFVTTWIDIMDIVLSDISQMQRDTIWFHSYVECKKKDKINELFFLCVKWYNSLIDTENKLIDTGNRVVTSRGGSWEVAKWIKGVKCMVMDGN